MRRYLVCGTVGGACQSEHTDAQEAVRAAVALSKAIVAASGQDWPLTVWERIPDPVAARVADIRSGRAVWQRATI